MASREKQRRIDTQWQTLQPSWGKEDYGGERRMLYDAIVEGDNVEHLFGCSWGSYNANGDNGELIFGRRWGSDNANHDRGVAAATERGLVLLNRGRLTKNVERIPYLNQSQGEIRRRIG